MTSYLASLKPNVVLGLPKTIAEERTEPLIDLNGYPIGNGARRYEVLSFYPYRTAERQEEIVEIKARNYKRARGYNEALTDTARRNGVGRICLKIGEAHGHPEGTSLPELSRDGDVPYIEKEMEKMGLKNWLEILLYYKKINPRKFAEEFREEAANIYDKVDGRPRVRVYNTRRGKRMGISVVFWAYNIDSNGRISEVPVRFDKEAFKYLWVI